MTATRCDLPQWLVDLYESYVGAHLWGHLDTPRFDDRGKVHDWRNYILEEVRDNWSTLSAETRALLIIEADRRAGYEDWD